MVDSLFKQAASARVRFIWLGGREGERELGHVSVEHLLWLKHRADTPINLFVQHLPVSCVLEEPSKAT